MNNYKLTDEQHALLLITLGMALSSCRGDIHLIIMVRTVITIFAPDSDYALKDKQNV